MMRFYTLLIKSKNYNILIESMLFSAIVLCIFTVVRLFIDLIMIAIGGWNLSLHTFVLATFNVWLNLFNGLLTCAFVILACKKSPRFIFVLVILMAAAGAIGFGFYSIGGHCAIMGIVWYWIIKKNDVNILNVSKKVIVGLILFGLIKVPIVVYFDMMYLSDTTYMDYIESAISLLSGMVFNPEFFLAFLLYKETKNVEEYKGKVVKTAFIIWALMILMFVYNNIQSFVEMEAWEAPDMGYKDSLEEGDWSEWTTEDDLKKLEEPDWKENE